MNIRDIANFSSNYSEINREERNYCAIFFAALCRPGNAGRFLKLCETNNGIDNDFGIYFEYSYLRDLWYNIGSNYGSNNIKKEIIRTQLTIDGIDEILNLPFKELNRTFGVGGQPSSEYIQFPGKWSLVKYKGNFKNNEDFLKICRFKWSFNIKPDIVIHLSKNKAICIEAKYESGEGSYPSSEREKSIFRDRGLDYVGQNELQQYMMEELLGIETKFIFLVYKKEASSTRKVLTWKEVFECLDMSDMPDFALQMAKRVT